jgi:hypothetical protein
MPADPPSEHRRLRLLPPRGRRLRRIAAYDARTRSSRPAAPTLRRRLDPPSGGRNRARYEPPPGVRVGQPRR